MSLQKELMELEATANQISRLINAMDLMATGLDLRGDPYADVFFAVNDCLVQAGQTLREQVSRCMKAQ